MIIKQAIGINSEGLVINSFSKDSNLDEYLVIDLICLKDILKNILSVKNVKSWIKTQKELMTTLRNEVRRDVKGAKAKLADADGYIRHMRHYLKHGDWCNDFYGHYEDKRIKWQTIVPKG